MSATHWSKFYWSDWESDEALNACSPSAQALWMRMLCIMAKRGGYLVIAANKLGPADLAQRQGWPVADVTIWWEELRKWEVFSVDVRGRVFCRRMVRAAKLAKNLRKNTPSVDPKVSDGIHSTSSESETQSSGRLPDTTNQEEEVRVSSEPPTDRSETPRPLLVVDNTQKIDSTVPRENVTSEASRWTAEDLA